jgi:hypothetical protein
MLSNLSERELELANQLYGVDLHTFGYPFMATDAQPAASQDTDPASFTCLGDAASLTWHWGPTARNTFPSRLQPCR